MNRNNVITFLEIVALGASAYGCGTAPSQPKELYPGDVSAATATLEAENLSPRLRYLGRVQVDQDSLGLDNEVKEGGIMKIGDLFLKVTYDPSGYQRTFMYWNAINTPGNLLPIAFSLEGGDLPPKTFTYFPYSSPYNTDWASPVPVPRNAILIPGQAISSTGGAGGALDGQRPEGCSVPLQSRYTEAVGLSKLVWYILVPNGDSWEFIGIYDDDGEDLEIIGVTDDLQKAIEEFEEMSCGN